MKFFARLLLVLIGFAIISCSKSFDQKMLGEWTGGAYPKLTITQDGEHFYVQSGAGPKKLASVDKENKILTVAITQYSDIGDEGVTSTRLRQFIYDADQDKIIEGTKVFSRVGSN